MVEHVENSKTYGVVEEISHMTDSPSALAGYISSDFGDVDVEICGGRTKRALYHIFVWRKKPVMKIVERYMDLPHDDELVASLLQQIAQRYDTRGQEVRA